jgi:hypothetical protein
MNAERTEVEAEDEDEELDHETLMKRIVVLPVSAFEPPKEMPAEFLQPDNREVLDIRDTAYIAAMSTLINGKLAELQQIPEPPQVMVEHDCLILRRAILGGSRIVIDDDLTLQQHESLFPQATDVASHVIADLQRQINDVTVVTDLSGQGVERSGRLAEMEIARTKFLYKQLSAKPQYVGNLCVRRFIGQSFKPSSGWLNGTNPELTVVLRPLGAGLDPEETVATSQPASVNKLTGDVVWQDQVFNFDLDHEPTMMQIQVMYRTSTLGSKAVPLRWMPEYKDEKLSLSFRISAEEMKKMEGVIGKVGRSKLGKFAGKSAAGGKGAASAGKLVSAGAAGKMSAVKSKANVKSLRMSRTAGERELVLKARKHEVVLVNVVSGQLFEWEVLIEEYDIGFQVTFEGDEAAEHVPVTEKMTLGDPKVPDAGGCAEGTFSASACGRLIFNFDNSHSKLRPKKVLCGITCDGDDVDVKKDEEDGNKKLGKFKSMAGKGKDKAKNKAHKKMKDRRRKKIDIPEDEHLRLLMIYYKKFEKENPKPLDEITDSLETDGFDLMASKLEDTYGESPYDIWEGELNGVEYGSKADSAETEGSWAFRADEFKESLVKGKEIIADIEANWEGEDASTMGHLLIPAAEHLLIALVIEPENEEVLSALAKVADVDLRLLTTILTSTIASLSEQECKRLKGYCARVALQTVAKGRTAMQTGDMRTAMKMAQIAMQVDVDNDDASSLFELAESSTFDGHADAEDAAQMQALTDAQATLDDLVKARKDLVEEFEDEKLQKKYAAKILGHGANDGDDSDDGLADAQQEKVDEIDASISEADDFVAAAKQEFFKYKAPVMTGWLVPRFSGQRRLKKLPVKTSDTKRYFVLKGGFLTCYEGETDSSSDGAGKLAHYNLADCDDCICEDEGLKITLEFAEEGAAEDRVEDEEENSKANTQTSIVCDTEADYENWNTALYETMNLIHGEGWDEDDEEIECVGEGTLHLQWKFDFRKLVPVRTPRIHGPGERLDENECNELFDLIDENGDGQLGKYEIKSKILSIQRTTGLALSAKQIWKHADVDGSHTLDKDEFFEFMQSQWDAMGYGVHEHLDEDLPAEDPSHTLGPDSLSIYRTLCRELVKMEFRRKTLATGDAAVALQLQDAVDWILEEINFRCGVGDNTCKLMELTYAVQQLEKKPNSNFFSRVNRALKKLSTAAGLPNDYAMFKTYACVKKYLGTILLDQLALYKSAFPVAVVSTEKELIGLIIECFKLCAPETPGPEAEPVHQIKAQLVMWPQHLLSTIVGTDLSQVPANEWHTVPFKAKTLSLACEIISDDILADDETYRFLFPDEIMVADIVCEAHLTLLERAARAVMYHCREEDYSKGNLLTFYQATRDLFAAVRDFCPLVDWAKKIRQMSLIFEPVLDAHIVRVQVQQEKWIDRSIRQDKVSGWALEHMDTHSSSIDDILRMLSQVTKQLLEYWDAVHVTAVVIYAVDAYCSKLHDMDMEDIRSQEGDDDDMDGFQTLIGIGGDVADIGLHALQGLSNGVTGIFTETLAGAKSGNVLKLGMGITKGLRGAATGIVATGIGAVSELTDASMKLAMTAAEAAVDSLSDLKDETLGLVDTAARRLGSDEEEEQDDDSDGEEGQHLPVAFYTRLNNILKAHNDLASLAVDPTNVIGELHDEDVEGVEDQFLRSSSKKHGVLKFIDQVLARLGMHTKDTLMGLIAIQVQNVTSGGEAEWESVEDYLSSLMIEPNEYLHPDVFYKVLTLFCTAWSDAVVGILEATPESLPDTVIRALSEAVKELAENFWQHDEGGLSDRDLEFICGMHSHVWQVLKLHTYPSEILCQMIATNATAAAVNSKTSDMGFEQNQLALSVLARRPDYMLEVSQTLSNPGVELSMFLPPAAQMRITSTPAKMVAPTSERAGYLWKESERSRRWQKRWFVLWRHPSFEDGPFYLLWFETEESTKPKGALRLAIGTAKISHPKSKRKEHSNAFRLDVLESTSVINDEEDEVEMPPAPNMMGSMRSLSGTSPRMPMSPLSAAGVPSTAGTPGAGDEPTVKRILATDSYEDMVLWMKSLEEFTTDPDELLAKRAEEKRLRDEANAQEVAHEQDLEVKQRERQEAVEQQKQELQKKAEAEATARDRAAFNRERAEELAKQRTEEAAMEKAMIEREKADAKMKQEEAEAELAALQLQQAQLAEQAQAADELEKRGAKKKAEKELAAQQEALKARFKELTAAKAEAQAEEAVKHAEAAKAAELLAERLAAQQEQEEENEIRAREEEAKAAALATSREAEEARIHKTAEEEATREAEEEKERRRLKGEIENAEARAKALSMTLPAADKVRLDSTPATVLMPSAIKSGMVSKEGTAKVKGQPTAFQEVRQHTWVHIECTAR